MFKEYFKQLMLKKAKETKSIRVQKMLSKSRNTEIKIELSKNENLFSAVLHTLIHDDSVEVREKIAKHIEDSMFIDEMIACEEEQCVLERLARNKKLSDSQDMILMNKGDEQVRSCVAERTKSKEIMKMCALDKSELVRIRLTGNVELEHSVAMILLNDKSDEVRYYLACRTRYEDVLDILSRDSSEDIVVEVAVNPCTNNATLYQLTKNPKESIRAAVAMNENLSKRLKRKLRHDSSNIVRSAFLKIVFW